MPSRFPAGNGGGDSRIEASGTGLGTGGTPNHSPAGARFPFRNFAEALSFTNRVGSLAEAEGHHPAILTERGQVTVTLWTHKIRALHRNDFLMAAKIDSLSPAQS